MLFLERAQAYWWRAAGYSNPNSKSSVGQQQETYKPRALRIPALLCLFFLFSISFTALELLLERTVKPSEFYRSHGLKAPEKRQVQDLQCPSPEENSDILESLRQRQSALCTTYTTTFKPSTTDLSPPMQTSFDSWLAIYSAMEAQLEFAESCASSQSLISSISSVLATATATRVTVLETSSSDADRQVSLTTASQGTSLSTQTSSQVEVASTISSQTGESAASQVASSSLGISIASESTASSTISRESRTLAVISSVDVTSGIELDVQSGPSTVVSTRSTLTSPASSSDTTSRVLTSISDQSIFNSSSTLTTQVATTTGLTSSILTASSTSTIISSTSSTLNITSTSSSTLTPTSLSSVITTSGTIATSSETVNTTASTTLSATPTACTELLAPCSDCDYEYCYCDSSDSNTRKRNNPWMNAPQDYSYGKRQLILFCRVDTCYCPWSAEELDYVCSNENTCNQPSSLTTNTPLTSTTTLTSVSTESTSVSSNNSLTSTIVTSTSITMTMTASSTTNDNSSVTMTASISEIVTTSSHNTASLTTTSVVPPTTSANATSTSSNSPQPVCTEMGTPCFECGQDYCLCKESGCQVDECHCSLNDSNLYTCTEESTCEEPPICQSEGDTCYSCDADFCTCRPSSIATKRQTGFICTVDTCFCEYNSTLQDYTCNADSNCECPADSTGQSCYSCEGSYCMCQDGNCVPETCIAEREGLGCSCEGGFCSCLNQTCQSNCFDAPDGEWCESCDGSNECICSDQSCVSARTCDGVTESNTPCDYCSADICTCALADGTCQPDPCYCTQSDLGLWDCGDIDLCNATSSQTTSGTNSGSSANPSTSSSNTVTTTSSLTREPPLPGATCPPSSPTCYNCVADRCACEADGYCYPDECWCDNTGPGTWDCGTINRCDPNACDTSSLQCFGCNSGNSSALCTCSYDGSCQAVSCAGCSFNQDGTELNCPDSCYTKRSASFNESALPLFKNVPRNEFRYDRSWGKINKRQGIEVLSGNFQTPLRDAWNYLLWTEPLTIRRTSSSLVSTVTTATFTLDVFDNPRSTSWPSLESTPPMTYRPTVPACIPATLIAPGALQTTLARRDIDIKTVKPYVTRESTTVVVRIRDNYLQMTSNVPTITRYATTAAQGSGYTGQSVKAGESGHNGQLGQGSLLYQFETVTMAIESVGSDGKTTTQSVVVIQPSTVETGNGPLETGDPANSGRTALTGLSDNKRVVQAPFTRSMYFAALYLPALMAVAIKILYETIVASIKMMEPFERLHRQEGSAADDSLSSEYLSSSFSLDVIRSIWSGRSIPLWTVIIYVLITVAAPLSSASMTVRPMDTCLINDAEHPCMPAWIVDLSEIRILEAFLAICMALTLVLAWDSWNYHAGVPSNPTSIAAMAVLLNYEPLRSDLQLIKPKATDREMRSALQGYHFWLLPHYPSRVQTRYGIIHSPVSTFETSSWMAKLERARKIFFLDSHGLDILHMITTLALLALLTTYRANLRNDAFNYFFASSSFWPKFILVCLATVIDIQWKNLEREVRIAEPYRRLSKGNARPENTILWPMNGTCWSNLPRCLRALCKYSGMWFEALVGFTAILSDVNIIAVAGVLMSYSQTKEAYEWSSITALMCTGFMLCVLLLSKIWWRRSVSMLPRKPETIAAVLSYLCISRMAVDFANMKMEKMSASERDEMILALGRRYHFGLMLGEDGQERYCIDYDDYVHDDGSSERDRWLQEKLAAPAAVRLSI